MKINARDSAKFFANISQYRGVLFYGPDDGGVRELKKKSVATLSATPDDPMSTTTLSQDDILSNPPIFYEALASTSLLGDAPIILIDHATDKLSKLVEEALQMPECQNHFIISGGELKTTSSIRKLFEKHAELACFATYRDEARDIGGLLRETLAQHKIQADRDAIAFLSSNLGNDRGVTRQELEKICLFAEDTKTLSLEEAEELVGQSNHLSVDQLSAAMASGQNDLAMRLLDRLIAEGNEPIGLIRQCSYYFLRLKKARMAMDDGMDVEQAMNTLRPQVFFKQKPQFKQHLNRFRTAHLSHILTRLMDGERRIKQGMPPELICSQLFLSLTSGKIAA